MQDARVTEFSVGVFCRSWMLKSRRKRSIVDIVAVDFGHESVASCRTAEAVPRSFNIFLSFEFRDFLLN